MSTTDGDASSRLSHALEEILAKTSPADLDEAADDTSADNTDDTVDAKRDDETDDETDDAADTRGGVPSSNGGGEDTDATSGPVATTSPGLPTDQVPILAPGESPTLPSRDAATPEPSADWSVDDEDAEPEPYELPDIVPATRDRRTEQVPATRPAPVPAGDPAPAAPPSTDTAPAGAPTSAPATAPATSWSDHMAPIPAAAQGAPLRAPGRRPRVRRVTRVLRHIDPWSTFKVALLFSAVAYVVLLTAGVLLWRVADNTGTLANIERWFTQFGWETFELKGGEIFANAWVIGLFGIVALTGGIVLLATLFNLVSDIVGGVRVTVLEEEVVERTVSSTRRYVVRRPPTGAEGVGASDWDVDADDDEVTSDTAPSADWSVDDDDDRDGGGGGGTG